MLSLQNFLKINLCDCKKENSTDVYAVYMDVGGRWADEDSFYMIWAKLTYIKDNFLYMFPLDELSESEKNRYKAILTVKHSNNIKMNIKDNMKVFFYDHIVHSSYPYELEKKYVYLTSLFKYENGNPYLWF